MLRVLYKANKTSFIQKKVLDIISSNTFKNNTSGFLLAVSRDTLQSICETWLELLSL